MRIKIKIDVNGRYYKKHGVANTAGGGREDTTV